MNLIQFAYLKFVFGPVWGGFYPSPFFDWCIHRYVYIYAAFPFEILTHFLRPYFCNFISFVKPFWCFICFLFWVIFFVFILGSHEVPDDCSWHINLDHHPPNKKECYTQYTFSRSNSLSFQWAENIRQHKFVCKKLIWTLKWARWYAHLRILFIHITNTHTQKKRKSVDGFVHCFGSH